LVLKSLVLVRQFVHSILRRRPRFANFSLRESGNDALLAIPIGGVGLNHKYSFDGRILCGVANFPEPVFRLSFFSFEYLGAAEKFPPRLPMGSFGRKILQLSQMRSVNSHRKSQ
jgi:hypothetical protein